MQKNPWFTISASACWHWSIIIWTKTNSSPRVKQNVESWVLYNIWCIASCAYHQHSGDMQVNDRVDSENLQKKGQCWSYEGNLYFAAWIIVNSYVHHTVSIELQSSSQFSRVSSKELHEWNDLLEGPERIPTLHPVTKVYGDIRMEDPRRVDMKLWHQELYHSLNRT